jgi:hypothetical protein
VNKPPLITRSVEEIVADLEAESWEQALPKLRAAQPGMTDEQIRAQWEYANALFGLSPPEK